jgi:Uncharacterised nucleotidyltransferase
MDGGRTIRREFSDVAGLLPYNGVDSVEREIERFFARGESIESALDLVARERVAGCLLNDSGSRELICEHGLESRLKDLRFEACVWCVAIVRSTSPVLALLRESGIQFVVIKGPGIARHVGGIATRPFTDIDVLVSPSQFKRALTLLRASGFEQAARTRLPRQSLEGIVCEAVNLNSSDGGRIDLHQRVPPWRWGRHLTLGRLLAEADEVEISPGVVVPVASAEHNLLISALHIVSDKSAPGKSVMPWQDVIALSRICDPDKVVALAAEARLEAWLRWIVASIPLEHRPSALAVRLLGQDQAGGHRLKSMLGRNRLAASPFYQMILRLPTSRAALLALAVLVPQAGFLRSKFGGEAHPYIRWYRRR